MKRFTGKKRTEKKSFPGAIIMGGSAGSFKVVTSIIAALPPSFNHPVILCLHRLKNVRYGFLEAISINSALQIREPNDHEVINQGIIYLAPANYHMMIGQTGQFSLSVDEAVNHSRPAIDVLFDSAAEVYGENCVAVILSGANSDGAKGMLKLMEAGATTIVQDPTSCEISEMPKACLRLFNPSFIMSPEEIKSYICAL